jgi:hypothetical protein
MESLPPDPKSGEKFVKTGTYVADTFTDNGNRGSSRGVEPEKVSDFAAGPGR